MTDPYLMSLLAGTVVGGTAAYLGSLMITRRMALVGDALGHVALPGMGLALLAKVDPSLGAFVFLALGIVVIWKLGEKTSLSMETLVGLVFVTSLALGFLIVPQPELLESLIGDISQLSMAGLILTVVLCAIVFFIVQRIYPRMMLINLSPDLAAVEGVRESHTNLLYLSAIAVMVALGVKVTGSLLVGALVIIPSATARILVSNLGQYRRFSVGIGVAGCLAGILVSRMSHFPPGPAIILANAFFFLAALGLKKWRPAKPITGGRAEGGPQANLEPPV
jgi:ABC-type Mn2+/Zn2+ transport system permease subunit